MDQVWSRSLNHQSWIPPSFGLFGSLGKIDTARLPEFFAGSNLDQLKAQAAQGSGFCGTLRKEFPDLKSMASCELQYQPAHCPYCHSILNLSTFCEVTSSQFCRVYSEVRCAVWMCWMYLYCRFLQAVCQVAAIGCKKIQEGPTPMSRMLATMNSSFHLNSMTWFFGTNCRQNFTQTVALWLFQPFPFSLASRTIPT